MKTFEIDATFAASSTITAYTHSDALERFCVEHENRTGFSYPDQSAASVRLKGSKTWRHYVAPDGWWQREYV